MNDFFDAENVWVLNLMGAESFGNQRIRDGVMVRLRIKCCSNSSMAQC